MADCVGDIDAVGAGECDFDCTDDPTLIEAFCVTVPGKDAPESAIPLVEGFSPIV